MKVVNVYHANKSIARNESKRENVSPPTIMGGSNSLAPPEAALPPKATTTTCRVLANYPSTL